jgi:hypothetical protein
MAFTRSHSAGSMKTLLKSSTWLVALGCGLFLSSCISLSADTHATKAPISQPIVDQGVVFPPSQASPAGVQDKRALALIHSYQTAVGPATWMGMEATGRIYPGTTRTAQTTSGQDASLWILGHQGYRLDIKTPKGPISIRMNGAYGAMQPPESHVILMDAPDAVAGLLVFPQLQDPGFPAQSISLIDEGRVSADGVVLRRITMEVPWAGVSAKSQQQSGISITDLYFDPATHLLVKSANVLQGTDPRMAHYMKVVTYGDYRPVNGVQIPFRMSESLNGRPVWTLQINHAQFSTKLTAPYFSF